MNEEIIKELVNRFLAWKLPPTVYPDCGKPPRDYDTGTNLLSAEEARQMFRHALDGFCVTATQHATEAIAAERSKNLEIARLIMANDRAEAVKWAAGLVGSPEDGVRIDESAIAAERAEVERLRAALERLCTHEPRTPEQIDTDWNRARAALATPTKGEKS